MDGRIDSWLARCPVLMLCSFSSKMLQGCQVWSFFPLRADVPKWETTCKLPRKRHNECCDCPKERLGDPSPVTRQCSTKTALASSHTKSNRITLYKSYRTNPPEIRFWCAVTANYVARKKVILFPDGDTTGLSSRAKPEAAKFRRRARLG